MLVIPQRIVFQLQKYIPGAHSQANSDGVLREPWGGHYEMLRECSTGLQQQRSQTKPCIFPHHKMFLQVASKHCRDRNVQRKAGPSTATTEYAALKSKLTYPEFLDALVVLGERMYRITVPRSSRSKPPGSRNSATRGGQYERSVESTFQQVLVCVLMVVHFLYRDSVTRTRVLLPAEAV